jgi:GT2 family glycosyltransferase
MPLLAFRGYASYRMEADLMKIHLPSNALPRIAIACFSYSRPAHLSRVLSALALNLEASELPLIIFVDGAKTVDDEAKVALTLEVARTAHGFLSVDVRVRSTNLGLYHSLTTGISEVLIEYEAVIVVEDDIATSAYFLRYMIDGLMAYWGSPKVASIHGYLPPIRQQMPETFFLRGADCWGWATWQDRWSLFRQDAGNMAI